VKSWFKRVGLGEKLGDLIMKHLDQIPDTDLAKKMVALRKWAHGS
jgi:hypothetical protein